MHISRYSDQVQAVDRIGLFRCRFLMHKERMIYGYARVYNCGRVTEIENHPLADALAVAAKRVGFAVGGATVEAEGLCADRGDAKS
jgi:Fe2+ or Zn2+ uptake regulation protein